MADRIVSSDIQFTELILSTQIPQKGNYLSLDIPDELPERRIYFYIEVIQAAAAAFALRANLITKYNKGIVGRYPATIADFATGAPVNNQSVFSMVNAGGGPVGDSLVIRLANPFTTATQTAVIQPLRINETIDNISLEIESVQQTNVTGWRAFLAILSSLT